MVRDLRQDKPHGFPPSHRAQLLQYMAYPPPPPPNPQAAPGCWTRFTDFVWSSTAQALYRAILRGPLPAVAAFEAANIPKPLGTISEYLGQKGVAQHIVGTALLLGAPLVEKAVWGGHALKWQSRWPEATVVENSNHSAVLQSCFVLA